MYCCTWSKFGGKNDLVVDMQQTTTKVLQHEAKRPSDDNPCSVTVWPPFPGLMASENGSSSLFTELSSFLVKSSGGCGRVCSSLLLVGTLVVSRREPEK